MPRRRCRKGFPLFSPAGNRDGLGSAVSLAQRLLVRDGVFRHVLVPIDLSDRQHRVLEVARGIAAAAGARITLLHVVQRIEGIPPRELATFYERLEAKARRRLEQGVRQLAASGIRASLSLLVGDPAVEILREARRRRVDLIVLGSHHVGRNRARGLGTTSYKVGLLCHCPVLLVK